MTAESPRLGAPFETQFHAGRAQEWIIQQLIRQVNTALPVKVTAVFPTAGTVGFVDVMPLIQQTDTIGTVIDAVTIFQLPYLRAQGGLSAIILDPAVGDIGLAVFAQRDISSVVATRAEGPAATNRAYDAGDGLYMGGFLNADPTQFVEFLPDSAGINITTPGDLTVQCDGDMAVTVGGSLTIEVGGEINVSAASTKWSGPVEFADPITAPEATINNVAFTTHKHISTSPGNPTGAPIN